MSERDRERLILAARARMTQNALHHLKSLDPRTAMVLDGTGLVQIPELASGVSDLELAVLGDGACSNRVALPPGPLVCYWSDNPSRRSVLDVRDGLLLQDERGRTAALEYFLRLTGLRRAIIAPASEASLLGTSQLIRSRDPALWRPAALSLHDSLTDDFFLTLAGFVQCRTIGHQEGASAFATTLMRPSLRVVDSISLAVRVPGMERDQVLRVIERCRDASNGIDEACGAYYAELGHLPLDHTLGIGRVVERWTGTLAGGEAWDRVWRWADGTRSPIARYHACLLFLESAGLIPEDRHGEFRDEILAVIGGLSGGRKESRWSVAWRVRCDLARHYAYYFECQAPGLESERVANLAWWLADRVGTEFGQDPDYLGRVHSQVVLPALSLSGHAWELLRPGLQPSALRFATVHLPSCWSLSLLCEIGQFPGKVSPRELMGDRGSELRRAIITATLGSFPPPREREEPVTYGFDRGTGRTADAWLRNAGDDSEDGIVRAILAMDREGVDLEEVRRRLILLPDAVENEQILICQLLRVLAFTSRVPDDLLWEFMTREEWFSRVLETIDPTALDLLFDALVEHLQQRGGRWVDFLPNLVASNILRPACNLERRRLLLAYCLIASLAGGTVEALAGILHSEGRTALERDLTYWRRQCEDLFALLPAYGQARLRPVLAIFSRMQGNPTT